MLNINKIKFDKILISKSNKYIKISNYSFINLKINIGYELRVDQNNNLYKIPFNKKYPNYFQIYPYIIDDTACNYPINFICNI
jgi:hypothetical protein